MRALIIISGIIGTTLIVLGLIGIVPDVYGNEPLIFFGLFLIVAVCIPLLIIHRYKQDQKINNQITSDRIVHSTPTRKQKGGKLNTKSWGVNSSPFRERKSGLNSDGGNIHGAKATRGKRRSVFGG